VSLDRLLCGLSYPRPVADTSSDAGQLALGLWDVEQLDRDSVAELAITSACPDLSFADRMRVIADNLKRIPDRPPARAQVIGRQSCETFGTPVELAKLVVVNPSEVGLNKDVIV